MANKRHVASDYSEGCITQSKRTVSCERRYNAANFRIPFRINWAIILVIIVSISVNICQSADCAERQVSVSINNISNKFSITYTFMCFPYNTTL